MGLWQKGRLTALITAAHERLRSTPEPEVAAVNRASWDVTVVQGDLIKLHNVGQTPAWRVSVEVPWVTFHQWPSWTFVDAGESVQFRLPAKHGRDTDDDPLAVHWSDGNVHKQSFHYLDDRDGS